MKQSMFNLSDHSTRDLEILERTLGISLRDAAEDWDLAADQSGKKYEYETLLAYRRLTQGAHQIAAQREQEAGYKNIVLEFDQLECTLAQFLEDNVNDCEWPIEDEDAAKIKALKLGEVYSLNRGAGGTTEIKRIK